ncbi:antitoxin VapB family protein [Halosimplex rubrum]|uniref:Antitoxin VapB family protein n=1 Tax=Halosimplex rubrum TaxID=869889 RepID=A0A7D5TB70_9EURY|nr:antitoxin VapB family protein [Halosimplex rubrum]QLH76216.1 antitoxin VapB family protein [Halosimplex rubrum]
MGTKTVRLDDDVYERIKSRKQPDETFSDAIERLTSEWTLLDYADGESPVDPDRHRALIERSERAGAEKSEGRLERLGVDTDADE